MSLPALYINNNCGQWQIRDILQLQIAVPSKCCRRILRRLVCFNCGIVTTRGGFMLLKFVELEKFTVHHTEHKYRRQDSDTQTASKERTQLC